MSWFSRISGSSVDKPISSSSSHIASPSLLIISPEQQAINNVLFALCGDEMDRLPMQYTMHVVRPRAAVRIVCPYTCSVFNREDGCVYLANHPEYPWIMELFKPMYETKVRLEICSPPIFNDFTSYEHNSGVLLGEYSVNDAQYSSVTSIGSSIVLSPNNVIYDDVGAVGQHKSSLQLGGVFVNGEFTRRLGNMTICMNDYWYDIQRHLYFLYQKGRLNPRIATPLLAYYEATAYKRK